MKQQIYILWDASHIWGLLALNAANVLRLPYRLIKSQDIAHGELLRKPPALLLVPGGSARLKSALLTSAGRSAIQQYISQGGNYLGFCGGAGLGLSDKGSLALCPWQRAPYIDRIQHLVSGHVRSKIYKHPLCLRQKNRAQTVSLPVWWPGRFAPLDTTASTGQPVTVLARYKRPDKDLHLTDLPLAALPQRVLHAWKNVYGIDMHADFLRDQPCIIHGKYGAGNYILSYSHLETPQSPAANAWLAHIIHTLTGITPHRTAIPAWDITRLPVRWEQTPTTKILIHARRNMTKLLQLSARHHLLFKRTPWLWGWRAGLPGAALNNLYASLCCALSYSPSKEALHYWHEQQPHVDQLFTHFLEGTEGYMLAERLATTLSSGLSDVIGRRELKGQQEALFGLPMQGGGIYQHLVDITDEIVYILAQTAGGGLT